MANVVLVYFQDELSSARVCHTDRGAKMAKTKYEKLGPRWRAVVVPEAALASLATVADCTRAGKIQRLMAQPVDGSAN